MYKASSMLLLHSLGGINLAVQLHVTKQWAKMEKLLNHRKTQV